MTFTKAKTWPVKDLQGIWEVSYKIDGVRAFFSKEKGWSSRKNKPVYNLPTLSEDGPPEGYEAYNYSSSRSSDQNFKATIQAVRAKNIQSRALGMECLYSLCPVDKRLQLPAINNPSVSEVMGLLKKATDKGFEGIILRQGALWYKVKPNETMDVRIISLIRGLGKHANWLGAVNTSRGKVGTGFSDSDRHTVWINPDAFIGSIIEVSYMGITEDGKFRHPRFERFRDDKDDTDDLL